MNKNFRTHMITSAAIVALSVGALGIAAATPASATETSAPSTTITQSNGMVVVKNNSDHDIAVWMRWNRGANQQDWMVPKESTAELCMVASPTPNSSGI